MKDSWELIKPETDFFELESAIEDVQTSQRAFQLFGNNPDIPFANMCKYSNCFETLEKLSKGLCDFVFAKPNKIVYTSKQHVYSKQDAIKLWALTITALICKTEYWIDKINKYKDEFYLYPDWLREKCEFATTKFLPLFKDYIRKDEDCGYLADMIFLPINMKIPYKL